MSLYRPSGHVIKELVSRGNGEGSGAGDYSRVLGHMDTGAFSYVKQILIFTRCFWDRKISELGPKLKELTVY